MYEDLINNLLYEIHIAHFTDIFFIYQHLRLTYVKNFYFRKSTFNIDC